jgi:hypothetical protein
MTGCLRGGVVAAICVFLLAGGIGSAVQDAGPGITSPQPRSPAVITPIVAPTDESLYCIDWNPSNGTALMAGVNGTVLEYNTTTGFRSMKQDDGFTFRYVAFRPLNTSTLAILAGDIVPSMVVVALVYDGTGFTRLSTAAYTHVEGIAWSPDASYALLVAQKGNNGVILKYQGGALSEVREDFDRNYWSIGRGDGGALVGSYNFNSSEHPLNLQVFDGANVTAEVEMPYYLNSYPLSVSWSPSIQTGLLATDSFAEGKLVRFNSTTGTNITDQSIIGSLRIVEWAHSRPMALITGIDTDRPQGSDGLLYSYNGSALKLESSGRYYGLNDLAWHPGDKYALVTGDNGTVLRYAVPNSPPWCAITSPGLGEVVNGTVNITGTAWDPDSDPIMSVRVRIDTGIWQTATGGTEWNLSWDTTSLANGAHTIYAKSNDGLEDSVTVERMVIVSNPDRPPAISISSPSEGAAVQGTVNVAGGASDPDAGDSVTSVQVAIDDGQWANASGMSSWTYSWDTISYQDGPHRIRARAYDGELYSPEAVRNVTLQNHGPNFPPSCTMSSPTSGSLVSGEVLVQGTATDAENNLQAVLVRIDSGGWQTASGTSSWTFLWDTRPVSGGSHTMTARAFDGVQNSSDVRITVQVGHQPVCAIVSPAAGAVLTGEVTVQGTATDSDPGDVITAVRVRIDSSDWASAAGTSSWTYKWNTSLGGSGQHVIRARCSDGTLESAEVSRTVTVEKPPVPVTLSEPAEMGEEYIVLHWTTNADSDFARYEVFISENEGAPLSGLSPRVVPAQSVTVYNYTGLAARTTYWFRVRVVDTSGQSSVSNEVFATTARANIPPVAILTASRMRATVGGSISFSAQGSYDRDGRITRYQWDFDGRGRFPLDTGPIAEQRHQFGKAGKFLVQVRITDDRGGTNTSSVEVTIVEQQGGGIAPMAIFAGAVIVILVAGAAAYLFLKRAPPPESYYEHEVHRPAAERRRDFWPEEEEPTGYTKKVVKKRRV